MRGEKLVAHWPLDGDARDAAGNHHGRPRHVRWAEGPGGSAMGAALFNGKSSVIEIGNAPALQLGAAPFTFTARVRCRAAMRGMFGDILSKFDARARCGINVNVSGGSAGYGGQSHARHLHAGIDDAWMGPWQDHGRPEMPGSRNPLVSTLLPFNGSLYAGVTDAFKPADACRVFRWAGADKWRDCGRVSDDPACPSIMSLLVHDGQLYAGTGSWDWWRAELMRREQPAPSISRVCRYEGGRKWRDLQFPGRAQRLFTMASFEGKLYAATDRGAQGRCYSFDGGKWSDCGTLGERDNFECLLAHGGRLYGASHVAVYRYEGGRRWRRLCQPKPFGITQIHSLQGYGNALWIGTWPQGYILRYEEGGALVNTGLAGLSSDRPGVAQINEVNSLGVHNGKLYAGVLPKAQIYRYEKDAQWTLLGGFAASRAWDDQICPSWMRILTLVTFRGALFAATGASQARTVDLDPDLTAGRVVSCQAGFVASHDRDLGDGWNHIAVVRDETSLALYVNGRRAQRTPLPRGAHPHLGNGEPLLIGCGAQGSFDGAISDVRLYAAALDRRGIREEMGA